MYQTILFDLDGTLTDPGEGITNSVAYARDRLGLPPAARESLYRFIGPPLHSAFMEFCGLSSEGATQAIALYREYYRDRGIYENMVYDGIPALLAALREAGKTLIVATSKPEAFAVQILEHFQLAHYFDCIAGASMDSSRSKKADVIAYALARCGVEDVSGAVMVGDREHDVYGAAAHGMDCIGVLFGYGSEQELRTAGATRIADSVAHLQQILLEK